MNLLNKYGKVFLTLFMSALVVVGYQNCAKEDSGDGNSEKKVYAKGDLDGDGKICAVDALHLARYLEDLVELNGAQKEAADFNSDNNVDDADVDAILEAAVTEGCD